MGITSRTSKRSSYALLHSLNIFSGRRDSPSVVAFHSVGKAHHVHCPVRQREQPYYFDRRIGSKKGKTVAGGLCEAEEELSRIRHYVRSPVEWNGRPVGQYSGISKPCKAL